MSPHPPAPDVPPEDGGAPAQAPDFRSAVLEVVRSVPQGRVLSYGGVALLAGHPRSARGVGAVLSSCGEDVPWWRIVNAGGRISPRPTAQLQRALLQAEGVVFSRDRIDLDCYGWVPMPSPAQAGATKEGPSP